MIINKISSVNYVDKFFYTKYENIINEKKNINC